MVFFMGGISGNNNGREQPNAAPGISGRSAVQLYQTRADVSTPEAAGPENKKQPGGTLLMPPGCSQRCPEVFLSLQPCMV